MTVDRQRLPRPEKRETALIAHLGARHDTASRSDHSGNDQFEQDAATILPDWTLNAGALASGAAESFEAVDVELFSSSVPVSSNFFPT